MSQSLSDSCLDRHSLIIRDLSYLATTIGSIELHILIDIFSLAMHLGDSDSECDEMLADLISLADIAATGSTIPVTDSHGYTIGARPLYYPTPSMDRLMDLLDLAISIEIESLLVLLVTDREPDI
jgi:hypothetical protein